MTADPDTDPAAGPQAVPLPPRLPVTGAEIDRVVARFYARIRSEPELGPIFARHVADWPEHEARIARFWRSAILMERSYEGSPMRAHFLAGDVRRAHFTPWLALFDAVLREELAPEAAAAWSALAHRIGAGLRMGVEQDRTPGGVPTLR